MRILKRLTLFAFWIYAGNALNNLGPRTLIHWDFNVVLQYCTWKTLPFLRTQSKRLNLHINSEDKTPLYLLYNNLHTLDLTISWNVKKLWCKNIGKILALLLVLVITLTAFRCKIHTHSNDVLKAKPHTSLQYDKYGRNSELYNKTNDDLLRTVFDLYNTDKHLDNLLQTPFMCNSERKYKIFVF